MTSKTSNIVVPFEIEVSVEDLITLCNITQKPCRERSLESMIEHVAIMARFNQSAINVAKMISPARVAELARKADEFKRNTLDDIEEDYSRSLVKGADYLNKDNPVSAAPDPQLSSPNTSNPTLHPQPAQICHHFIITIHNTHLNKFWPAMIHPTTPITNLAKLLSASEGIPLTRMRLMHNDNDLLITARAKADPLQDGTTFGYYNVRLGDLVSLSMITEGEDKPVEVFSPRAKKSLSIIEEEEGGMEGLPYGRAASTHRLIQRSREGGALEGLGQKAKVRADRAWPGEVAKLRKAQSLDALPRTPSSAVSPVGSPIGLGIGGHGEQQGGTRLRAMKSLGALHEDSLPRPRYAVSAAEGSEGEEEGLEHALDCKATPELCKGDAGIERVARQSYQPSAAATPTTQPPERWSTRPRRRRLSRGHREEGLRVEAISHHAVIQSSYSLP